MTVYVVLQHINAGIVPIEVHRNKDYAERRAWQLQKTASPPCRYSIQQFVVEEGTYADAMEVPVRPQ